MDGDAGLAVAAPSLGGLTQQSQSLGGWDVGWSPRVFAAQGGGWLPPAPLWDRPIATPQLGITFLPGAHPTFWPLWPRSVLSPCPHWRVTSITDFADERELEE